MPHPSFFVFNGLGTLLIGLGLAETFVPGLLVPVDWQVQHYNIGMLAAGVLLDAVGALVFYRGRRSS